MKTLDGLIQGSDEWQAARARYNTASEASIIMGASSKATRNDLLRMKATGSEQEFSDWVLEVLFERGHQIEEAARPIAERIIGEELYPSTGLDDDGYLLASFDGITLLEDVVWECKQHNAAKAETVSKHDRIPAEDYWQVVQQLYVSGASKALYMVTDGTEDGTVYTWKTLTRRDELDLVAGWRQFDADLADWQPEPEQPEVTGVTPESLPALRIEVQGMVTASNLEAFRDHALAVFEGINTDLQDDQDFADAEKTAKWCKEVEQKLDAAKDHAQSQMESVDALFRAVDEIREQARQKRLDLEKLVKKRKEAIRHEIIAEREKALQKHMGELKNALEHEAGCVIGLTNPEQADFAAAIKGKKTVKSVRDAADQTLANAKLAVNAEAERIRGNLVTYRRLSKGYTFLFRDASVLLKKAPEDLEATVKARIAEEEGRLEAERERIRQEEARKAEQQKAETLKQETQQKPPAEPAPAPVSDQPEASPKEIPHRRMERVQVEAHVSVSVKAGSSDDEIRTTVADLANTVGLTVDVAGHVARGQEAA